MTIKENRLYWSKWQVTRGTLQEGWRQREYTIYIPGFTDASKMRAASRLLEDEKTSPEKDTIHFTSRELECMRHLSFGKTMKQIGRVLDLSPRTIESYLNKIKLKTNCRNKRELLVFIDENKLFVDA